MGPLISCIMDGECRALEYLHVSEGDANGIGPPRERIKVEVQASAPFFVNKESL